MATSISPSFDLIGVGNPIMDLLAHVDDAFLRTHVAGDKGGMILVDHDDIAALVRKVGGQVAMMPGGSAANATLGAARLGLRTTYLGKIGGDPTADAYVGNFTAAGGDGSRFKRATLPNGRCLSLVTPDGQRTLRTHLGAAMTLHPDEITAADFAGARHAHIEGYLLFNPALADKVVATARAAGCTISIDLASFEVVNVARDWILGQLRQGVHVVFANEDEAGASLDDVLGQDIDLNMPDGQFAVFVRRQFADSWRMLPTQCRGPRAPGGRDRPPPRSKADSKKPKVDMKDRKCSICNESGHPAARYPKAHVKALTREGRLHSRTGAIQLELSESFRAWRRMTDMYLFTG